MTTNFLSVVCQSSFFHCLSYVIKTCVWKEFFCEKRKITYKMVSYDFIQLKKEINLDQQQEN